MKKFSVFILTVSFLLVLFSCKSTKVQDSSELKNLHTVETEKENEITLLFGGDIMAHSENYNISSYDKIWESILPFINDSDLAFANIEAPVDTTKEVSSYPYFNMNLQYVQAAINAGFDVFSLCNNHTNDQSLSGIKETQKNVDNLTKQYLQYGKNIYFSGLKEKPESSFTYNLIEYKNWKILFLPITELLNRPDYSSYINYVNPDKKNRDKLISYIKELKSKNYCDIFILSVHTAEPEYIRKTTKSQEKFYKELLAAGVDIVWANHPHIIKNREIIYNSTTNRDQLIMYANGNTISGQRRSPDFTSPNPVGERDNTGDGLLYKVKLKKDDNGSLKIEETLPFFITTYINPNYEFIIKPLNQDFVDYLNKIPRSNWAKYIGRRIKINSDATKDIILWQ